MKVEAAKIASTSSNSAFCLPDCARQRKSDLLEVEILQYDCTRTTTTVYCIKYQQKMLLTSTHYYLWIIIYTWYQVLLRLK